MKDRQILSRAGSVSQQSKSIHLGRLLVTPESVHAFWSDGLSSAARPGASLPLYLEADFSRCPPNWNRMADSSLSWKSASPRDEKRS